MYADHEDDVDGRINDKDAIKEKRANLNMPTKRDLAIQRNIGTDVDTNKAQQADPTM